MDRLLMSEEQFDNSLSDLSNTNAALCAHQPSQDLNGNHYSGGGGGVGSIDVGRDSSFPVASTSESARGDIVPPGGNKAGFPFPGRSLAGRSVEGWSSHMNNLGRRPLPEVPPPPQPQPPGHGRGKRSHPGIEDMITFSPLTTPDVFTIPASTSSSRPLQRTASMELVAFRSPPTSLVLTAASPGPPVAAVPLPALVSQAGQGRYTQKLVPHQSAGEPFWFPSPSAQRTLRTVESSSGYREMGHGSGNDPRGVPDLRSIASGALVDIEIPSSYAGSSVSITGSQTTLLSTASPYKRGSVRRSMSADSLFGRQPSLGECPAPLVVLPGSNRPPSEEGALPMSMKRTTSLDQLCIVSPYPMPPLTCFVDRKTAEMVRSMSMEERASLALSMDEPICRICWQGAEAEECMQTCYCSTYVHQSCVQRWLSVAKITYCEVCRYQYKAYRKMKPLSEWRWWPHKNRHLAQLEATVILLGVVTPPLLCGIILCSQKIAEYLKTPENAWKTAGLMTLVMVSVGTYLGAILYFCHKFATVCKIWTNSNRTTVVTVVPLTPAQRRPKLDPCRVWSIS